VSGRRAGAAVPSLRSSEGQGSVWAIVVHHGALAVTWAALAALRAGERAPDRVVVVDNQGDPEVASLGADDVVRPGANIGFAGAAAEGTRRALAAGAAWLWFVNNDAEVAPDCLSELLWAAGALPRAGLLSPAIVYRDDGALWFAGASLDRRSLSVTHSARLQDAARPYQTECVTGCAMLARAAMVDEIGSLDESLFMYLEDVDWSLRARESGWQLVVVPAARAVHDVPRSAGRRVVSPLVVYLMTRNRLVLARRRGTLRRALPSTAVWDLRQVAKATVGRRPGEPALAAARGLADGLRGTAGPPPPRWLP
jgi:GT2 family glycosyltransferase